MFKMIVGWMLVAFATFAVLDVALTQVSTKIPQAYSLITLYIPEGFVQFRELILNTRYLIRK